MNFRIRGLEARQFDHLFALSDAELAAHGAIRRIADDDDGLPNARPIAFSDSPRRQRSHNSSFATASKPRTYLRSIGVHSIPCI
jgi:hypothetical protein